MKLPKSSTIFQSLKNILKYIFIILLAINLLIYIFVFIFQGDPGGEIVDNINERNKMALMAVFMLYVILYSRLKGEKVNSWF